MIKSLAAKVLNITSLFLNLPGLGDDELFSSLQAFLQSTSGQLKNLELRTGFFGTNFFSAARGTFPLKIPTIRVVESLKLEVMEMMYKESEIIFLAPLETNQFPVLKRARLVGVGKTSTMFTSCRFDSARELSTVNKSSSGSLKYWHGVFPNLTQLESVMNKKGLYYILENMTNLETLSLRLDSKGREDVLLSGIPNPVSL